MAVTGQTLSLFAGALKRDYHGPIIDALNNMSPLYRLLSKNEEDVSGDTLTAYVPIKTRRNQGMGARAEGGVLPSARYTKTVQLAIPLMYSYGAIEFTGQTIKASQKSKTAFAKVTDLEIKSMVEGMKIDTNRQLFTSKYGYLCQTNGTHPGTAVVTVDHPGTQMLEEGMPIITDASVDGSTGEAANEDIGEGLTEATAYQVGGITSTTTFNLEDSSGNAVTGENWHTDHYMFRYGAANYEMNGLMDIVDDYSLQATSSWYGLQQGLQTIHGQSRSTYPILESVIAHGSNTNRDISEAIIQDHLDTIEKASGKQSDHKSLMMVTTYGVRKMYIDLLQGDRRYVQPLELVGGWKAIAYQAGNDQIPIIVDRHCIPNTIFILDRRYLQIYRASNFEWMDMDGSMFDRKYDSSGHYDAYEAKMYCYMNLGCSSFRNQGAIRDISES